MSPQDTALILLASGASSRFGTPDKLLAEFNGRTILENSLAPYAAFEFGFRLGVVKSSSSKTVSMLKKNQFEIAINPRADEGMGTSVAEGVKAARQSGYQSVMIALADMPFLPAEHVQNLLHAALHSDIVMTCVDKQPMPPALFSGTSVKDLTKLEGDRGAKSIAVNHGYKAVILAREFAIDIDRPEDLTKLTQT